MTTQVTSELVITKCDYFTDVQLWPLKEVLPAGAMALQFH